VLGSSYAINTPALADLDGDGLPEIIVGNTDGKLYAWKSTGVSVPGFPFTTNGGITCSPAIGYLDGPGDATPEIVFTSSNDSLYVLNVDGKRRAGWPVRARCGGVSRSPSPALADMNNDGFLDVVHLGTEGLVFVYNRNATVQPLWNGVRYTTLTSSASESSPVVADINGDGFNDVVCGGEEGQLTALSGANASVLPGFPIQLAGEVRGTPALADVDKDGKTEIVLAGWDKNIYIWDYDFPFSPGKTPPWPQFHHDAMHTGFASAETAVSVPNPIAPKSVALSAPFPNPVRQRAHMSYGIPNASSGQDFSVDVFDAAGRRVHRLAQGVARPGRYDLEWDLRDAHGALVGSGLYLLVLDVGGERVTRRVVALP